jgi:hypothetical protein
LLCVCSANAPCKGYDASSRRYGKELRRSAGVNLTGIDNLVRPKALYSYNYPTGWLYREEAAVLTKPDRIPAHHSVALWESLFKVFAWTKADTKP